MATCSCMIVQLYGENGIIVLTSEVFGGESFGHNVANFSGNAGFEVGGVKVCDGSDAGSSVAQRVPEGIDCVSDGRYNTHSSYDNSLAHNTFSSHCAYNSLQRNMKVKFCASPPVYFGVVESKVPRSGQLPESGNASIERSVEFTLESKV